MFGPVTIVYYVLLCMKKILVYWDLNIRYHNIQQSMYHLYLRRYFIEMHMFTPSKLRFQEFLTEQHSWLKLCHIVGSLQE